eukprot:Sdes_comp9099_c0_seq1m560
MAVNSWIQSLTDAKKTVLLQDGKKKIHFTLSDGSEMVEEYDSRNMDLLVRKHRKKNSFGKYGDWIYEIGEPNLSKTSSIVENVTNPQYCRKDTLDSFQWRIRNLPYPIEVYNIGIEEATNQIVIKTTNKKYFKRISVEDMDRFDLKLTPTSLTYTHSHNTLLLCYKKPAILLETEKRWRRQLQTLQADNQSD